MATITSKIFRLVTPTSENDSNYEEFEFLLGWYAKTGQFIVYMFTDFEARDSYNTSILNIRDVDQLQNIIGSQEREVKVVAENLTLNDLKILASIYQAKKIIRIYKDGTTERVGINNNTLSYRQTDGRYNLTINIILNEQALPQ